MTSGAAAPNARTRMMRACELSVDDGGFFPVGYDIAVRDHQKVLHELTGGFAVMAVAPKTMESSIVVCSNLSPGELRTLVIGRHDHADIAVQSDKSLSLRHAMVILKIDAAGKPFVRVLDLRSIFGVRDADNTPHLSVASNGPVALRLADTALFVVPQVNSADGAPIDLSTSTFATVTWPAVNPYVPEDDPESHLRELSSHSRCSTAVSVIADLRGVPPMVSRGPQEAVNFSINGKTHSCPVQPYLLRAGILIGRYERCDISAQNIPMPQTVSRVHALLISIDGGVHLFDAGSQNGIVVDGLHVKQLPLTHGVSVTVKLGELEMKWGIGR
jgi:hypothetical protein